MDNDRPMICDRCRRAVPMSEMKYLPKGKDQRIALCSDCRAKFLAKEKEGDVKKDANKSMYFCMRCNFKFKYDSKGETNLKCPYCGKSDKVAPYRPPSADALLRDIEDPEHFYAQARSKNRL